MFARLQRPAYGRNDARGRWWNRIEKSLRSNRALTTNVDRCCCFFKTNAAILFFILILSTIVAQGEIFRELVIINRQMNSILNVIFIKILVRTTLFTFEAIFTFPMFGNIFDFWLKTERVIWSITDSTKHKQIFISCFTTILARFTIQAFPI